jgi:hypothetical protein
MKNAGEDLRAPTCLIPRNDILKNARPSIIVARAHIISILKNGVSSTFFKSLIIMNVNELCAFYTYVDTTGIVYNVSHVLYSQKSKMTPYQHR